jgi:hypothetical protein
MSKLAARPFLAYITLFASPSEVVVSKERTRKVLFALPAGKAIICCFFEYIFFTVWR